MPTLRVFPPNAIGSATITVNGRTYTTTSGAAIDVPDFDALVIAANGWSLSAPDGSGASSARPANPQRGAKFADTTLGVAVVFDGKVWRNKITGAAV
jgi:hypothetical protein